MGQIHKDSIIIGLQYTLQKLSANIDGEETLSL